jgi:hypothetical protein
LRLSFKLFITVLVLFAFVGSSCLKSKRPGIPLEIIEVLNKSGIYKPTLMKVILEFQKPDDSLKLKSAYYLISNLDNNYSIKRNLVNSSNSKIDIRAEDFEDLSSIKKHLHSIEEEKGSLTYLADSIWLDFKNITAEFLINHINQSYKSWAHDDRENSYSFDVFCNSILPYRVANEEIETYLSHFKLKFGSLFENSRSIENIAQLISQEINSELKYDERYEIFPNARNIEFLERNKIGNLHDINIYKIKALRSVGIAAELDYTPFFADSVLGYYSTTVILPNSRKLYLKNPDNVQNPYQRGNVAKVYRRSFRKNPKSLFSTKNIDMHTPPFLGNYNYTDVTSEYIITKDINVRFPDSVNYGYLAVFNDEEWRPVDWAKPDENGNAIFKNMGTEINYKPAIIIKKEVIPIPSTFCKTH